MSIFGSKGFDASNNTVSNTDFSPLAPGMYDVIISDADVRVTKAGNGQYLSIQFTVTSEVGRERRLWTNLNLVNPNPVAVEIAQEELQKICNAIGYKGRLQSDEDIQHLLNKALAVKVVVDGERNNVKGYAAIAAANKKTAATAVSAAASDAEDKDEMPWG